MLVHSCIKSDTIHPQQPDNKKKTENQKYYAKESVSCFINLLDFVVSEKKKTETRISLRLSTLIFNVVDLEGQEETI